MDVSAVLRRDKQDDFLHWAGARPVVQFQGRRIQGPLFINRATMFQSVHLVSAEALHDLLPTEDLHPVRWFDGRGLVILYAARYSDLRLGTLEGGQVEIEPYGEAATIALVSREPLRRGLPLLRPGSPQVGGFVLDMPVTHRVARDSGRELFGFPKFVADLHFSEAPDRRLLDIWDDGVHALSVDVEPRGRFKRDRLAMTMYSELNGRLVQTTLPFLGWGQTFMGCGRGRLLLGNHPMGDRLRALDVSLEPLMGISYVDARMILPAGVPIGQAGDYVGHVGKDRPYGEFTVRYPQVGTINQYRNLHTVA